MEKIWLVKASNRILGPYDLDELKSLILDLQVSMIDEIKTPISRWKFVREHSDFRDIVLQVRQKQADSKEDTVRIPLRGDEFTQTPTPIPRIYTEVENKAQEEPLPPRPAQSQETKYYAPINYGHVRTANTDKASWVTPILWGLVGVAVFLILKVMFAPSNTNNLQIGGGIGYEEYLGLAKYHQNVGDLAKSFEMYSKALAIKDLDGNSKVQMASLMLALQGRTVEVRRLIDEAKKSMAPEPEGLRQMQLLVALSFVKESRLEEAKTFLSELKDQDPLKNKIGFNYVALLIRMNQFKAAFDEAKLQIAASADMAELYLLKAVAAFRAPESTEVELKESIEDLVKFSQARKDYLLESIFLKAVIEHRLKKIPDMETSLKQLLDMPYDLTKDHVHDVYIDWEPVTFAALNEECQKTANFVEGYLAVAMRGYCHLQSGQTAQASEVIDKGYYQYSSEPILRTLYAMLLVKQNRFDEVKSLLRLAITPRIRDLITAELCVKDKNWSCAETSWKTISELDPKDLYAIKGLATKNIEIGQKSVAETLVNSGLQVSPNFQPFMEMKERLSDK
jgi:tetratricopeptide (TPR) repeat protein